MHTDPAQNEFEGFLIESQFGKTVVINPPDSGVIASVCKIGDEMLKQPILIVPGGSMTFEADVVGLREVDLCEAVQID